jgi:putative ABC transport system permease protein
MDWRRLVRDELQALTGDAAHDAEIVEELADDLAQRFEEHHAGAATEHEARDYVRAELGDAERLAARLRRARPARQRPPAPPAVARPRLLAGVGQDVRYAARVLWRSPGFALPAILTLAIGLGAVTAIFSVIDAVLLKPVPFPHADRLVAVWETDRDSGTHREPASLPDLLDFERRARRIEQFGGAIADELTVTPIRGEPMRLAALAVTPGLLELLGIHPSAGRLFSDREHRTATDDVVLITDRLWTRLFNRDRRIIGRTIRLDDRPRTVVGVLPDTADLGILQWLLAADYSRGFADRDARSRVDAWVPLSLDPKALPRSTHPVLVLGRVAAGVSIDAAQGEMAAVMAALEREFPDDNKARGAHVEPLVTVIFGPVRPALGVLGVAVALVLLLAAANVANLVLVRATTRAREVALRTALGATPSRLTRQFVIETSLVAAAAAVLGIAIAAAVLRLLVLLAPADVPRIATVGLDARLFFTAFGVAALLALIFGALPALQARRLELSRALAADETRTATVGRSTRSARASLIVGEIALAVVLTVGAGLLIRTLWSLEAVDPGFRADGILKAEFQLPQSRYPQDYRQWPNFVEIHRFNTSLLRAASALPSVEGAAVAAQHPLDAGFTNSFTVVGREAEGRDWPEIALRRVSPSYFRTMQVPLVEGRLFTDSDTAQTTMVVLVNEAAAARFFSGRTPVGQQIRFWGTMRVVVGVVGNERFHGVAAAPPPATYAPLAQAPSPAEVLLVRSADPLAMANAVRAVIAKQDAALALFGVEPLRATLDESLGRRRFVMLLLAVFAVLAMMLAAVGIHAVLSYDVAQRTREIGIRMALGALPGRVMREIVGRGARLALVGLLLGIAASLALTRFLASLLFQVQPIDAPALLAATVALAAIAVVASYLPARRAIATDPVAAIRDE